MYSLTKDVLNVALVDEHDQSGQRTAKAISEKGGHLQLLQTLVAVARKADKLQQLQHLSRHVREHLKRKEKRLVFNLLKPISIDHTHQIKGSNAHANARLKVQPRKVWTPLGAIVENVEALSDKIEIIDFSKQFWQQQQKLTCRTGSRCECETPPSPNWAGSGPRERWAAPSWASPRRTPARRVPQLKKNLKYENKGFKL